MALRTLKHHRQDLRDLSREAGLRPRRTLHRAAEDRHSRFHSICPKPTDHETVEQKQYVLELPNGCLTNN